MMHRFISHALLFFLSALLIAGCGWRLRGSISLPPGLEVVYVQSERDGATLARTMEDVLRANRVSVVDQQSAAQVMIRLLSYNEVRRVVSVGDNTLVTEYELITEAFFSVEDSQGNELLPESEASMVRPYEFDQDNVLGMEAEERLILDEMRRELSQQILRRLRFLDSAGTSGQ